MLGAVPKRSRTIPQVRVRVPRRIQNPPTLPHTLEPILPLARPPTQQRRRLTHVRPLHIDGRPAPIPRPRPRRERRPRERLLLRTEQLAQRRRRRRRAPVIVRRDGLVARRRAARGLGGGARLGFEVAPAGVGAPAAVDFRVGRWAGDGGAGGAAFGWRGVVERPGREDLGLLADALGRVVELVCGGRSVGCACGTGGGRTRSSVGGVVEVRAGGAVVR
jgi:hypothetical protein